MVYSPYLLPFIFRNYITPISCSPKYETRHNKLYLTRITTRFGQQMLRYESS